MTKNDSTPVNRTEYRAMRKTAAAPGRAVFHAVKEELRGTIWRAICGELAGTKWVDCGPRDMVTCLKCRQQLGVRGL